LEDWHPWWRPELVRGDEADNNDDNGEDNSSEFSSTDDQQDRPKKKRTLDERILAVPSFETLRPPRRQGVQSSPPLQYNLVDIIYGIVWMLRLYHGPDNACDTLAGEAFYTLIGASAVLPATADASFCFSSVHEALADCTRRSTAARNSTAADCIAGAGECNAPWTVLCQDVALICQNHRRVARALLEASDVVKAAVRVAKKDGDAETILSHMRKTRKKLEFLLSWFLANQNAVLCLSGEIEGWAADWDIELAGHNEELESLQLPGEKQRHSNYSNNNQSQSSSLLIEEIGSRKL